MPNELSVIQDDVLTQDERSELDKNIDSMILQHKDNRQEINRLVFESVAAMTEADIAQAELSNKGFFSRFIGGITGSNQKLQNKINTNRAAVQYASQQTLQKLAEQNLMSFDLITAVNNKLNASINAANDEFKNIYAGLNKFLRYNRNELARVEARLAQVEQNVNLLTWQNTIEYQEYDGEEYIDMDIAKKLVCLTRDFYDITKGNWSTSDLLLLKTAMSTINIQPKDQVNYYGVLREISHNPMLKDKLLGNAEIKPIEDTSYLISMGTLEKLGALEHRDAYLVDTVMDCVNIQEGQISREDICDRLTYNYLVQRANVNLDVEVECYDLILDFLYNLKQANEEDLLVLSVDAADSELCEAEQLYLHCKMEEAAEKFQKLAEAGNARAMYFLNNLYFRDLPASKQNWKLGNDWRKRGAEQGDLLCRLIIAYNKGIGQEEKDAIIKETIDLANNGDIFAQTELGAIYLFFENNIEEASKWFQLAASQGYFIAMDQLGDILCGTEEYEDAIKWYEAACESGYDVGYFNLARCYKNGNGVKEDKNKAIDLYERAYALRGSVSGRSALQIGYIYDENGEYEEANEWYKKSGEAGFDWGWYSLGTKYQEGKGVSKDMGKAIECYRKAYELKGDTAGDSALEIGNIYNFNERYGEANEWFEKSGEAGCDLGWSSLGFNYVIGNGVQDNVEKGIELYKKGYELNGPNAGIIAEEIGDTYGAMCNDTEEQLMWYSNAVKAGNHDALEKFDNCLDEQLDSLDN